MVVALVAVERRTDLGDAWVGIVGALSGAVLTAVIDRVKWRGDQRVRREERAEDALEARAQWVRDLRVVAYEELMYALLVLGRALYELAAASTSSQEDADRIRTLGHAWVVAEGKVDVYGSSEVRAITAQRQLLTVPPDGPLGPDDVATLQDQAAALIARRVALLEVIRAEIDQLLGGHADAPA